MKHPFKPSVMPLATTITARKPEWGGMFFPDKTALYICGFVRAMLAAGLLYTTSERGEAFIAYRLPGER